MVKEILLKSLLLAAVIALVSCGSIYDGKMKSTGQTNEILTVTGDRNAWLGKIGDSIQEFFGREMPGLSQPEPMFNVSNISASAFSNILQLHHNILIIEISPEFDRVFSETKKDLWSSPQRVIKVTAPDTVAFMTEFRMKKTAFLNYFEENERERTQSILAMAVDNELREKITQKFGFSLEIPGGFFLAKETGDLLWFRHKLHKGKQDIELGVLIYVENYVDTIAFDPRYIIRKRDMITMEHIPGPSENSFMKVAPEYVRPESARISGFPAGFAVETRGLWDVANDFMGGSFLSYTFVDEIHHRVVTLDGYVYNPNNTKKDYIRQLESIFYSIRFAKQD